MTECIIKVQPCEVYSRTEVSPYSFYFMLTYHAIRYLLVYIGASPNARKLIARRYPPEDGHMVRSEPEAIAAPQIRSRRDHAHAVGPSIFDSDVVRPTALAFLERVHSYTTRQRVIPT